MATKRRFSTTCLLGGLGLLSTGAVLAGMLLLPTQEEHRSSQADRVSQDELVHRVPADAAPILEPQAPRGSTAASAPPRPGLRARTGAGQRAIPPTPSQPTVVGKLRVDPLDEDDTIVEGETLRRAIEEVEETFGPMMPRVSEALSDQPGMGLRISSNAGTATLDSQGFTLTELDPLQSFGLEVGDTIVSVNGRRVDGLGSAWWIFQDLKNRDLTGLRLEIYREGARLYKTYRVAGR